MPAFTDSVDTNGALSYSEGVCGEKIITLDPSKGFLTLTPDPSDPILNDFLIAYTESSATEADIMMHTISYTVSSKEYGSLIPDLTSSSFTFNILCPSIVTSSSVSQAIESPYTYDIARRQTDSIDAPILDLLPAVCFTVEDFRIYDDTGAAVTGYITSNGLSLLEIQTTDRNLVGTHTLTVKALVHES